MKKFYRRENLHIAANQFETKIVPSQDILTHRPIALAAKILRQDNDSPMRMVSFKKDTAGTVEVLFRRVGRPRKQWTQNTLSMIWLKIRHDQFQQFQRTICSNIASSYQQRNLATCLTRFYPGHRN